jgi:dCTP deaminase
LKVVDSGISSDEAETVENWIGELVADALAIRLSGPCVVFALWQSSLIANVMDQDSRTHPSTRLRLAVGIAQLSGLGYVSLDEESIGAEADGATCPLDIEAVLHLLWPGCRRELTASSEEYHGGFRRERAAVLAKAVLASLQQQVDSACPEPFDADMYKQTVKPLVDHLRNGRPPIPPAEASSPLPAVFNAVWEIAECHKAEIFQGFRFTKLSDLAASLRSLSELALKGIEAWHVRHSWSRGRARRAKRLRTGVQEVNRAVLSWATLRARLDKDLFVEPILDEKSQLGHGSIDLRLGTQFIVTRLGDLSHFDPTEMRETEIRRFQENVSKSFGETFVLHPQRLVLGVTFEYITLPLDLAALVVSRSSYGRIGLIVATAAYVHPGWKGCLTLELSNASEVPIELPCGAPVAQLVVLTADRLPGGLVSEFSSTQTAFPTRPEFSRLGSLSQRKANWSRLRRIAEAATWL